jgi:hypothetical protein
MDLFAVTVSSGFRVECSALLLLVFSALAGAAQSATGPLPPLAPPYGQLQPTFWERHGTALIIAGLLVIVLGVIAGWIISRPKPAVVVPPEIVAREALLRLRGQPEDGRVLSEISQIIRRCLAAVLGLPPVELTTAEFSAALTSSDKMRAEQAPEIIGFLRECDERKFAGGDPGTPLNAAERALAIVAEIENPTR